MESHQVQAESVTNHSEHKKGSILKQNSGIHTHAADHVKFDEEIISEHDKERGSRQKIEEAKTPYHQQDESDQVIDDTEIPLVDI